MARSSAAVGPGTGQELVDADVAAAPAQGHPFVAHGGPGHLPALVHAADDVVIRHEDVIEEDLVELGVAR